MSDPQSESVVAPPRDFETALHMGDKLELRVWLRLLTCSTLLEKRIRARLRDDFDITLPRFDVLAQLNRSPDGLTMGDLSGRLMVSAGNITGLIERLTQEGMVSRTPAPQDRRTQRVRLTAAGKKVFDEMASAHQGWVEDALDGLDRREMQDLLDLLGRLKTSLNGIGDADNG